ncbi:MAG: low molecular weight protein-tyrosine-phosphatase [Anaerorhabdus sp.]|uniref:low molecular weight protein-tyrosine-phosphatase n=1 Tax=Anaerorhabdus sp. TaxID=1872524 RepID=UPI003A855D0B
MKKIMMVCHGNICRSPMAKYVMKDYIQKKKVDGEIVVDSCGTSTEEIGNGIHQGTKKILDKHHIPYDNHRAKQVTQKDYDTFDVFYCMDEFNLQNMHRIFKGDPLKKIEMLIPNKNIADPWYTGDFEITYKDVVDGCKRRLSEIMVDLDK